MILSKCCNAKVDTDIMVCSDCRDHLGDEDIYDEDELCETCGGEGEIVDNYNIREWSIDIPYTTCPDCGGTGRKEE